MLSVWVGPICVGSLRVGGPCRVGSTSDNSAKADAIARRLNAAQRPRSKEEKMEPLCIDAGIPNVEIGSWVAVSASLATQDPKQTHRFVADLIIKEGGARVQLADQPVISNQTGLLEGYMLGPVTAIALVENRNPKFSPFRIKHRSTKNDRRRADGALLGNSSFRT